MTLRWLARAAGACVVALFATTAIGAGAAWAGFEGDTYKYTDDGDPGGSSGSTWLQDPSQCNGECYAGQFWAKGENFHLWDFLSDGHRAEAVVIVYEAGSGDQVDVDRFSTATNKRYNLGTPDGSGNIPDGYQVSVRVRPEGGHWSPRLLVTA